MKAILALLVTMLLLECSFCDYIVDVPMNTKANRADIDMKYGLSNDDQVPYLAYIMWENGNSCAGTLISHRYVLTAAHCVLKGIRNSSAHVSLGKIDFWERFEYEVSSKNIKMFRDGKSGDFDYYHEFQNYDIALIELSQYIPFSNFTQPANLPSWIDLLKDIRMETGKSLGWDINRNKVTLKPLSRAHMICHKSNFGNKKFDPVNTLRTHDLSGTTGSKACKGTSGGPFLIDNKVYGVTMNFKQSCTCGDFFFSKVTSFLPWIVENTDVNVGLYSNDIKE